MKASEICKQLLQEQGLKEWGVRVSTSEDYSFLGMCSYKDKVIILNGHHLDIHDDGEIMDTMKHEVAHALTPGANHGRVWQDKARELGCNPFAVCASHDFPAHVIDAIRSGNLVECTVEEKKVEYVTRTPKYTITQLKDKCPECGKVAVEKFATEFTDQKTGDKVKLITLECFHIIKKVIPHGTPFETVVTNMHKPEVKACKHDWEKTVCKHCGEFKLYDFQIKGARFAETGLAIAKGVGIFDDCGLGKTPQSLMIPRFHSKYHPFMVVTKSAITFQWFKAIIEWCGPEFMPQIIRTGKDSLLPGLKAYIIPYDLLRRFPKEKLYKLGIKLVILDECQQIKNPDSTRTQEVRKLVSSNSDCKVIELSATPWKNRGSELFPALNLIDPIKFHSYQGFLDTWVDTYYHGDKIKQGGIRNPLKFREFTKDLIIRREYEEVMDEFPEVKRNKFYVELDRISAENVADAEDDFAQWYEDHVENPAEGERANAMQIQGEMMRMRHIIGLAKIPAMLGIVESFVDETDRKMVIFIHHKDVGEQLIKAMKDTNKTTNPDWYELAKEMQAQGIRIYAYTSAHTGKPIGIETQDAFNSAKRSILVASTLACGEGLNLQTCSDCILGERQFNPQNEDQAAPGRFRRIGQKSNSINITLPEAVGTVDEDLSAIVEPKRRFFHAVMNKGDYQEPWDDSEIVQEVANRIMARVRARKKAA